MRKSTCLPNIFDTQLLNSRCCLIGSSLRMLRFGGAGRVEFGRVLGRSGSCGVGAGSELDGSGAGSVSSERCSASFSLDSSTTIRSGECETGLEKGLTIASMSHVATPALNSLLTTGGIPKVRTLVGCGAKLPSARLHEIRGQIERVVRLTRGSEARQRCRGRRRGLRYAHQTKPLQFHIGLRAE